MNLALRKRGSVAPERPRETNEKQPANDAASSAAYDAFRATETASPEALAKLVEVQRMYMQRVKDEALHSVRSFQMLLVSGLTPTEMRGRMITEFTALGVVCALLAGLGFSVMAAPPAKLLERDSAAIAFCAVTLLSIICNLACVGFSTLMISSVNLLTDEMTAWYIGSYAAIITSINFQFFNAGFLLLLAALVLFAVYTYPPVVAYVCAGVAVAAAALVITVYFIVDHSRFYKLQDIVQIILEHDAAAKAAGAAGRGDEAGKGANGGGSVAAVASAGADGCGGRSAAALMT